MSSLDIAEEELAAYSLKRQMFAANFFRRQVARYKEYLESAAIREFTKWWAGCSKGFNLFASTQQEFDGQAFAACDAWLLRRTQRQVKSIAAGVPAPPQSEKEKEQDEVTRIKAKWGISTTDAKRISKVIKQGVRRFVPELRNKVTWESTSLLFDNETISSGESDAIQDAWVKLLGSEDDSVDDGAAYSAGGSAGRKKVRADKRFIPISQLQSADPKAPEVTLDGVQKFFTDEDYRHTDESKVEAMHGHMQDDVRLAILTQFRNEAHEDYVFVVDYLDRVKREVIFRGGRRVSISKRGAKTTPQERKRASNILKRLRKWETLELQTEA